MVIRNLSLLILFITLVSCGAGDQNHSEVLLKGQLSSGMPTMYQDKNGLISTFSRQDMFLDTDKDKIRDRDDFDIDNDQVPNDCDLAPFDIKIGNEDADLDKIPDFCDKNDETQKEIFNKYGILLNINERDELRYNEDELKSVFVYMAEKAKLPSRELLTFTLTNGLPAGEYGVYDGQWKSIRYRTDDVAHIEFSHILISSWVLVHEVFHFVGAANKVDYKHFENPYFYPTAYSTSSKEEYYAELETFKYFFLSIPDKMSL